jgi:lipopolysaccharide export system protein LptC
MAATFGWLHKLWFRATHFAPMLVLALLALGTWWLARNAPTLQGAAADISAPTHEPDYEMRNFAVKNFDAAGRMTSEIAGQLARHYPDTDVLEIDDARIRSLSRSQQTVATAKRAYTNADGSEVQLVGDALVVREANQSAGGAAQPRLEFRSEFLQAYTLTEKIVARKPVTITRGNDQFVADSMEYDNVERSAVLQGRVKATLAARPSR